MISLRKLRRRLDERVQDAQAEAATSQERLDAARENVLTPLERLAADNHLAALVWDVVTGNGGQH